MLEIPSIVVEALIETPPPGSTRDIVSAAYGTSPPGTPTPNEFRFSIPDVSLALDGSKLQRSSKRNSEYSMFSIDNALRSPCVFLVMSWDSLLTGKTGETLLLRRTHKIL